MAIPNTFPDIPHEVKPGNSDFPEYIRDKTVVVDMGCGHGDFMLEFAPKNPDKFYIGIEIWRKRAHKTAHRLAKRHIKNFQVIAAPGEVALYSLFPAESVDELHINFPSPWLRDRHWKNRILKPSFLIDIHRVLKTGGELHFVTDVEYYAVDGANLISRFPGFKNNYDELIKKNLYPVYPTLFFDKMSPLRDINYVCFRKI